MFTDGFVILYRKLKAWEWYDDVPCKVLFIHLIISVNYYQSKWRNVTINPGQFISSTDKLAKNTGLSIQQLRTAIKKLRSTNDIEVLTFSTYSIFTLTNWQKYQYKNDAFNRRATNEQQTGNKRATNEQQLINNNNKENKDNNIITFFETCWKYYPSRGKIKSGKKKALEYFINNIKESDYDKLLIAIRNYSKTKDVMSGYAMNMDKFLIHGYWQDFCTDEELTAKAFKKLKDSELEEVSNIVKREREETRRLEGIYNSLTEKDQELLRNQAIKIIENDSGRSCNCNDIIFKDFNIKLKIFDILK